MKKSFKFFGLFCGIAMLSLIVLFACSPDSAGIQDKPSAATPKSGHPSLRLSATNFTNAKNLWIAMMGTTAWSNYVTSKNSFSTKMKTNVVYYTTKAQYMTWIGTNLASTSFGTTTAFSTAFDDMVGKYSALITANPALFNYLSTADSDQVLPIMGLGLSTLPTVGTTSCETGCYDTAAAAYVTIQNDWTFNSFACLTVFYANFANDAICLASADQVYQTAWGNITVALFTCVNNC